MYLNEIILKSGARPQQSAKRQILIEFGRLRQIVFRSVVRAYNECEDSEQRTELLSAIDLMAKKQFLGLDGLDSLDR
jgi:hypothetical protein